MNGKTVNPNLAIFVDRIKCPFYNLQASKVGNQQATHLTKKKNFFKKILV
jgi:hypothetical protein